MLAAYFTAVLLALLADTAVGSCSSDSASLALSLVQPTVDDVHLLANSHKLWQFATAADRLVNLATNSSIEDLGLLFLLDNHLPPASFLDSIEAMTSAQKTRTVQLSLTGLNFEVDRILEGLLYTLPKDDQLYASYRFVQYHIGFRAETFYNSFRPLDVSPMLTPDLRQSCYSHRSKQEL